MFLSVQSSPEKKKFLVNLNEIKYLGPDVKDTKATLAVLFEKDAKGKHKTLLLDREFSEVESLLLSNNQVIKAII